MGTEKRVNKVKCNVLHMGHKKYQSCHFLGDTPGLSCPISHVPGQRAEPEGESPGRRRVFPCSSSMEGPGRAGAGDAGRKALEEALRDAVESPSPETSKSRSIGPAVPSPSSVPGTVTLCIRSASRSFLHSPPCFFQPRVLPTWSEANAGGRDRLARSPGCMELPPPLPSAGSVPSLNAAQAAFVSLVATSGGSEEEKAASLLSELSPRAPLPVNNS